MGSVLLTQTSSWFLGPIAMVLGKILEGIYTFLELFGINNIALCIILFTFIVNALMIPLTIKQQKFSKLTAKMSPEISAIQAKYKEKAKGDQEAVRKMQLETSAVYQKYGTNPTSGCLPMFITLPIFFALYRVIYNIPAYVPQVKDIYNNVAVAIKGVPEYASKLSLFVSGSEGAMDNAVKVTTLDKLDLTTAITTNANSNNYIIDILSQFRTANWDELAKTFSSINAEYISPAVHQLDGVNSFLGFNIMDKPTWTSLSIIIPILAIVTQFASTRMMMAGNPTDDSNPAASSMKMMNNFMPFMSGFMCFMFPIGVGLYWVAGSCFRIIQSFFVNRYMNKLDLEDLIERRAEKQRKKKIKLGLDPNATLENMAKKRTSTISTNTKATNAGVANKNVNKAATNSKVGLNAGSGSVSGYANLLANKSNSSKREDK